MPYILVVEGDIDTWSISRSRPPGKGDTRCWASLNGLEAINYICSPA